MDYRRQQEEWDSRARAAQAAAAHALDRLLTRAERQSSGQVKAVASFLAATYNGGLFSFDLFDLRAVDVEISDDMLLCLDALRWGKADLYTLLPDGARRIEAVCSDWAVPRRTTS